MMNKSVTVSAKVPESLKKRLDELGINISETIREALTREVEKKLRAKVVEDFSASKSKILPKGTITRIIREIREES
ncbi:hypothetical protein KEJ51_03550 [Candidatus Bathyarchaeota archaeon]|nr:hypothetical protein [Candidatus Bathyarchaeota archaeon]MBS7629166.1 hypothetical protein [Candidatus Bathyarchaeota archaeon]